MARRIAILDIWLLMVLCNAMVLVAVATAFGLQRQPGTGSWGTVILCACFAGVSACLIGALSHPQGRNRPRLLIAARLLLVAVVGWLLWFQSQPWLSLSDCFTDEQSIERESMVQRIEQVAYFLVFAAAFAGLGFAHHKGMPQPDAPRLPGSGRRSMVAIATSQLALTLALRLFGNPTYGALWAVAVFGSLAIALVEFARRSARADRAALVAFAAVTAGMPVIVFWPPFP